MKLLTALILMLASNFVLAKVFTEEDLESLFIETPIWQNKEQEEQIAKLYKLVDLQNTLINLSTKRIEYLEQEVKYLKDATKALLEQNKRHLDHHIQILEE